MNKKYNFEDFKEIITMLRSENGCPWDKVQTHESLKPCMMEEAAELVASIRIYEQTGSPENMREELGDILLQVVIYSEIAKEEGLFTLDDVIQEVSEKMIRRHPHIFGDVTAETADQVLSNWDDIKKKEKEGKEWIESPLREIPKELPSLTRASKVLKKTDKLYEKTPTYEESVEALYRMTDILSKIEPADCQGKRELENTIGDMLLNLSNIAMKFKFSEEQVLTDKIEDIIDRFEPKYGK